VIAPAVAASGDDVDGVTTVAAVFGALTMETGSREASVDGALTGSAIGFPSGFDPHAVSRARMEIPIAREETFMKMP
jgi:hypothetical protein